MLLYRTPGVPEQLFSAGSGSNDIKTIESAEGFSAEDCGALYLIICDFGFYKKNRDLLAARGAGPDSIVVVYTDLKQDQSGADELVIEYVKSDQPDAFEHCIESYKRNRLRSIEYEKAVSLNRELLSIGIALSAERENDKLLDDILFKIRQITRADAGSLYLLENIDGSEEKNLLFKISHNDSNPSDFTEFRMPLNKKSIAGYVATTSEVLNIPDAYAIPDAKPYSFNNSYDIDTGYRSCSILTVPMIDHLENIIGVVQLINRKRCFTKKLNTAGDVESYVEPFDSEDEQIVLSLASQAAVSLENNILYNEIETLFEGFVAASVKAIESRDPTTSGHSSRVAIYSVETAKAINGITEGKFAGVNFSEDQLKELRYAGLLHDFGKVGVREAVLVKAKKLYPKDLDIIKMRFGYIRKCIELDYVAHRDERRFKDEAAELDKALESIISLNEPSIKTENFADVLKIYSEKTYTDPEGRQAPWLTAEEYELLNIKRGSLTQKERKEIESHVEHSTDFLQNIPWTSSLKQLPTIARGHHERMDGTGYPDGISADDIRLTTRIMAVADIYDALTANDRPYKKALSAQTALKILLEDAENNHLDRDIVDVFIDKKIYEFGVDQ